MASFMRPAFPEAHSPREAGITAIVVTHEGRRVGADRAVFTDDDQIVQKGARTASQRRGREVLRPETERSQTLLQHEQIAAAECPIFGNRRSPIH
jgi:ABC-type polar amino acid transport system ATPase subunit